MYFLLFRILLCIIGLSITLYAYVDMHNKLTLLQLQIPVLAKEIRTIQQANKSLEYEIDQFESPIHLMELASKPEFGHLKYPYQHEVITIK